MSETPGVYHSHPTPDIDVLLELLESFTVEQLQYLADQARANEWGFVVLGLKHHNPDVMLFVPSVKFPNGNKT